AFRARPPAAGRAAACAVPAPPTRPRRRPRPPRTPPAAPPPPPLPAPPACEPPGAANLLARPARGHECGPPRGRRCTPALSSAPAQTCARVRHTRPAAAPAPARSQFAPSQPATPRPCRSTFSKKTNSARSAVDRKPYLEALDLEIVVRVHGGLRRRLGWSGGSLGRRLGARRCRRCRPGRGCLLRPAGLLRLVLAALEVVP